jgi:hypothetical protein
VEVVDDVAGAGVLCGGEEEAAEARAVAARLQGVEVADRSASSRTSAAVCCLLRSFHETQE